MTVFDNLKKVNPPPRSAASEEMEKAAEQFVQEICPGTGYWKCELGQHNVKVLFTTPAKKAKGENEL